jgi:5-methylcytosine-specific restriction endonuclease McrA
MVRLDRKSVKASADWTTRVEKALPDPAEFHRKAKQFEKLAEHGKKRKAGFSAYAPHVLPIVDKSKGKIGFPAVWGADVALKAAVVRMSKGCCAYCQSAVSSNHPGKRSPGQVEHFKPKSRFPTQAYRVENYFLGCAGCNGSKGDKWPAGGYVQPDMGDPSRRFVFSEDGGVAAKLGDGQALMTCKDLELNRCWLKTHRRDAIQTHMNAVGVALDMAKKFGVRLSKQQKGKLLVAPLGVYSVAINQNVLAVLQGPRR